MRKPDLPPTNAVINKILDILTEAFPAPVELSPEHIGMQKGEHDEQGRYRRTLGDEVMSHTLSWLEEEGFVRRRGQGIYVVTLQTLQLKGAVPSAIHA
jgi:hypothetical protein